MTFKQGQSGNPNGRPVGGKNKRTEIAKYLESHAEKLIEKAIELALGGDGNALRLCIERLIPKARSEPTGVTIEISNEAKLSDIGLAILSGVFKGELNYKDGQLLSSILDAQRKLVEHTDLAQKLNEIETRIKNGQVAK